MAITSVKVNRDNMQTITTESKDGLIVEVYVCDADFKVMGEPKRFISEIPEEEFHKELRTKAAKHEHLITSHSTDPDWNPEGYVKNYVFEPLKKD